MCYANCPNVLQVASFGLGSFQLLTSILFVFGLVRIPFYYDSRVEIILFSDETAVRWNHRLKHFYRISYVSFVIYTMVSFQQNDDVVWGRTMFSISISSCSRLYDFSIRWKVVVVVTAPKRFGTRTRDRSSSAYIILYYKYYPHVHYVLSHLSVYTFAVHTVWIIMYIIIIIMLWGRRWCMGPSVGRHECIKNRTGRTAETSVSRGCRARSSNRLRVG